MVERYLVVRLQGRDLRRSGRDLGGRPLDVEPAAERTQLLSLDQVERALLRYQVLLGDGDLRLFVSEIEIVAGDFGQQRHHDCLAMRVLRLQDRAGLSGAILVLAEEIDFPGRLE